MTPRLTRSERGQVRRTINRLMAVERREFPSASTPGKVYVAVGMTDGKLMCNCQGWTIRKAGRPRQCKHTIALATGRATRVDEEFEYLDRDWRGA